MIKKPQLQKKFHIGFLIVGLSVISSYGLSGCAVAVPTAVGEVYLSKDRAKINVTEDETAIKGCKFIKEVRAKSLWGGLLFQEKALEKTIADITHEAVEAGANVLLIQSKSKSFVGSHSEGVAYLCPAADASAVSAKERLKDIPQN